MPQILKIGTCEAPFSSGKAVGLIDSKDRLDYHPQVHNLYYTYDLATPRIPSTPYTCTTVKALLTAPRICRSPTHSLINGIVVHRKLIGLRATA